MDIQKLTLGEIARIESIAEAPLANLADDNAPKGALLSALAFVMKRREDPKFTLDQAKELTMADIEALLADGDSDAKKE